MRTGRCAGTGARRETAARGRALAGVAALALGTFLAASAGADPGPYEITGFVSPAARARLLGHAPARTLRRRPAVSPAAATPAAPGPFSAAEYTLEERWIETALRPAGDGGGAEVEGLVAIQTRFLESNCPFIPDGAADPLTIVLLVWDTPVENTDGVDVIVDDALVATVADSTENLIAFGAPPENVAVLQENSAPTRIFIAGLPPGVHTFAVEDPGSGDSDQIQLEVLAAQPMADAEEITITETGPIVENDDGTRDCTVLVSFKNTCPVPDDYSILMAVTPDDGNPFSASFAGINSAFTGVPIGGAPPGVYTAQMLGFLEYDGNPNALYRSCFASTAEVATITCDPAPCTTPPDSLTVLQTGYGGADSPSEVVVLWTPGEVDYSGGTNLYINDQLFDTIAAGDPSGVVLQGPAGDLDLAVEGDCGGDGQTERTAISFTILAESPHQNPVEGTILCTWDNETGSTVSTWTNADCSSFIQRFLLDDPANDPEGTIVIDANGDTRLPGNVERDVVEDTEEDDLVDHVFFTWVDNVQHSSPRVNCTTEAAQRYFIRGVCNATGLAITNPQLTDAVFILNFLFQGGPEPACWEACDANDDGGLQLTDGVFILNFLFQGGPAPAGWDGDSPVCSVVEPDMDCQMPLEECPLGG